MYFGMCVEHYKCEETSIIRKIERLCDMGFKYMNGVFLQPGTPKQDIEDLKKCIKDNGVVPIQGGVHFPCWGSFDPSEMDYHLDEVKRSLDLSAELGNKLVCVLPAVWNEEYPLEVSWGTSIEYYRKLSDLAADRGLGITCEVEPERDFISFAFHDAIKWIEHVNKPNFYLNVDTGHFKMWKFKPEWLKKYADLVVHSHITETSGRVHQSWALGTGAVDNVGYINALLNGGMEENCKRDNIPCVTCLELYIPDHTGPNFDDVIKTSIDWMKVNLPEIKMS